MSKIDIDKFIEHLVKYGALNVNTVKSALYAQGLTLCDGTIQEIKEKAPEKIYIDANESYLRTFVAFTDKGKGDDIEYVHKEAFINKIYERLRKSNILTDTTIEKFKQAMKE